MKETFALLSALLFFAIGPLGAASADFHATNGKAPKDQKAIQILNTSNESIAPRNPDEITTLSGPAPIRGWLEIKHGLSESELKRQLGFPRLIESKGDYELWRYITGAVWVKDHKVVAWIQVILN